MRAWLWLKKKLAGEPPKEEHPEDLLEKIALQILRKMEIGNWNFSWSGVGRQTVDVIHPSIHTLAELLDASRVRIVAEMAIPIEAKRSPQKGTVHLDIGSYLADENGLFRKPAVEVKRLAEALVWLCGAIRETRQRSPLRADAYLGQCTYLIAEAQHVLKKLL